ncbi:hypothetical protein A2115_00855 [Candidatus Woesebacteria bacterium GWA1_41_8]|uniref:Uncharacterized protein n=1 Tax=Candidatus Woesebacteria bacterium GWA1_41_8 TaxID=1802471 RepID=A0A1F7WIX7_9BACT|nr:MAG: hypothetical protein A2115_00855 [Candidatus Woesebacteria bacterium GWA1_41_8]
MAEIATEVLTRPNFMLRLDDGSPVTIEFKTGAWEINPRAGFKRDSVKQEEVVTYNPRFRQPPPLNSVVEVDTGGEPQYFLVGGVRKGQEIPESVYASPVSKQEFEDLRRSGHPVVIPDNLPETTVRQTLT